VATGNSPIINRNKHSHILETGGLNEQAPTKREKISEDSAFKLTIEDFDNLESQIAISSPDFGGQRKFRWVFTEHTGVQPRTLLIETGEQGVYFGALAQNQKDGGICLT